MRKIRVLVVDDAVVVRKIVTESLSRDPEIEVAGIAANGKICLQKISQVNPDVVTLDINMPIMDGIEALIEIRKKHISLPVIMFSTLTERGGEKTLEALSLGANDYVTKPANMGGAVSAIDRIKDELIPKIKQFCFKKVGIAPPKAAIPGPKLSTLTKQPIAKRKFAPTVNQRIDIVAIGVSTGGPNALAELFPVFPKDIPVPIVLVQHMPPFFTKSLADRLSTKSSIDVFEGKAGDEIHPGQAWLAPGDFHMEVERKSGSVFLNTTKGPQENSCRPAVDVLFRTVAEVYGKNTLAVVLTGMGQDGLIGCEEIKNFGGQIIVQDEKSSVVWGMPGFVARAGLPDKILPLNQIGQEIIKKLQVGR